MKSSLPSIFQVYLTSPAAFRIDIKSFRVHRSMRTAKPKAEQYVVYCGNIDERLHPVILSTCQGTWPEANPILYSKHTFLSSCESISFGQHPVPIDSQVFVKNLMLHEIDAWEQEAPPLVRYSTLAV